MPYSQSKTTFVRPLCEPNINGNAYKSFTSPVQPLMALDNVNSSGMHTKFKSDFKHLDEMKSKHLNNINSVHSKLFAEVEEIHKWKTEVEMESRQKNKKVEELMQTIESQRKVVLDLQLQNENLSYRLSEEIQQRSFVLENLHSTKELCSALKKHYNKLQGQFNYRNKIEDMINVAEAKRLSAIEDLENKFEKICIEHSERVGHLNDALATETNKALNLKEALEREVSLYDNEKQSLCSMLSKCQMNIEKLSKELEEEITKTQNLFQEKCNLEMNVMNLEKVNDTNLSTIKGMERQLEALQAEKVEFEKKYMNEGSYNKDLIIKYEECLENAKCFKLESEENILAMKQTIDNLDIQYNDLLKRMEEEKEENQKLLISLENAAKEKCNLDKTIEETNAQLNLFENLKNDYEYLEANLAQLQEEKSKLCTDLEHATNALAQYKTENESIVKLNEESNDSFLKLKEEYESNMIQKEQVLLDIKKRYDKLEAKYKSLEEDTLNKSQYVNMKDKEIETLQAIIEEHKQIVESLRSDNATLKENFEAERTRIKVCLECESSQDKIDELETLKNTLKQTEEELRIQKRDTKDTMRMLNESEKLYNSDRIAKEKELIQYKNEIRKLEDEIKFKYVEREIYRNLDLENTKLKDDLKELEVELQKRETSNDLISENEKLKEDLREMEIKFQKINCEESSVVKKGTKTNKPPSQDCEKQTNVKKATKKNKSPKQAKVHNKINNMDSTDKNKKTHNTRKNKDLVKICTEKFKSRNINEDESSSIPNHGSPKKSVSAAPENKNVNEEETNSSSSDNFFEKIAPKICEKENKAWEVESTSSGSEYMDISFYQQQEAVKPANSKLMPSTPKHQNVLKNKPLPNGQQKRENQDVFSENTLVKRPCGNTPSRGTPQGLTFRKQPVQDSFWTRPFRTPDKLIAGTPEHNMDKVNYQKTPTITPQRRFFKTPVVNRDEKFKKPKLPWF